MREVIVIGDGPGGLSAALFLAKNNIDVAVYGQDKTAMNFALLKNYLGMREILGSDFQKVARKQVEDAGGKIFAKRIESVAATEAGYEVSVEGGETVTAAILILSEGKGPRLAKSLGLEHDETTGIEADRNCLTKLANVYVVGRSLRPGRSQAIISAGDGAAAAIDILSRKAGENVCDWDSPPEE